MLIVEAEEYCFINVGRAAGKMKFCMLDKDNSYIGDAYNLKAVLMLNRNGDDVSIQVLAFPKSNTLVCIDKSHITTIQHIVWQLYHSRKPSATQTIRHRNGNTLDNRVDNLVLCEEGVAPSTSTEIEKITSNDVDTPSLYSMCLSQLVPDHPWLNVPECLYVPTSLEKQLTNQCHSLVQTNQESLDKLVPAETANRLPQYYECHYLPCANIEERHLQYESCGGCRSVRYCSIRCQQLDWAVHKGHCEAIQIHQYVKHIQQVQRQQCSNQSQLRNPNMSLPDVRVDHKSSTASVKSKDVCYGSAKCQKYLYFDVESRVG